MSLSMYQASVPVIQKALTNLGKILEKGEAHATAKKIEPSVLLQTRLYPDMFPLVRQVQIASDVAKGVARLAGADVPSFEDKETSFAELQDRIARTLAFVGSLTQAQIDGSEQKEIVLKMRVGELKFTGQAYLLEFVLPNVFFHTTTTYAILRQCGVEIGKRDFLGG